ncbi:MAG: exosortase/archaeosortase family protein [Phycisphaerales bacterium]
MQRNVQKLQLWTAGELALTGLLLALAAWMCRGPLLDITSAAFNHPHQTHILLVLPAALLLLWLRRKRLKYLRFSPSLLGPAVILVGWLLVWVGHEIDFRAAYHSGGLLVMAGALLSVTGASALRLFLPVFAVFVFAIPVPGGVRQQIAGPLQSIATGVTHFLLELVGSTATREGNALLIEGQRVAAGEAMHGMRMIFALALIAFTFVFAIPFRPASRIAMLAVSPAVAILCNVIGLIPTSLLYGAGMSEAAETVYSIMQWAMLPIALLMLIGLFRLMHWLELPVTTWRLAGSAP